MNDIKFFVVKMSFAHPAWDEKDGYRYQVLARSKSEACKLARRNASRDGHLGRLYFKAEEVKDPTPEFTW